MASNVAERIRGGVFLALVYWSRVLSTGCKEATGLQVTLSITDLGGNLSNGNADILRSNYSSSKADIF